MRFLLAIHFSLLFIFHLNLLCPLWDGAGKTLVAAVINLLLNPSYMSRIKICPRHGEAMTEIFCTSKRHKGVICYPKNGRAFHFWVCERCREDARKNL